MQCVILAGGLGTRLRPITENIPKALVEINGIPFVDYQLDWLSKHGVTEVIFSVGYKGDMIEEHVGNGQRWGLKCRFIHEGDKLKGTAGALRMAADQGVLEEAFFILYGDSFLPIDFQDVWERFQQSQKPALMTIFRNEGQWDVSNVRLLDGQFIYDKEEGKKNPQAYDFIDYGLTALRRDEVEKRVAQGAVSDLAHLLRDISREGQLAGYEVTERFYEIGSPRGISDFSVSRYAAALSGKRLTSAETHH